MRTPSCPKCQGAMAEGFMLDNMYGGYSVAQWIEGTPVKSLFAGLKLRGKTRHPIRTWRCGRCGYLESYANQEPGR